MTSLAGLEWRREPTRRIPAWPKRVQYPLYRQVSQVQLNRSAPGIDSRPDEPRPEGGGIDAVNGDARL